MRKIVTIGAPAQFLFAHLEKNRSDTAKMSQNPPLNIIGGRTALT
jgi:hypothetical protein